MSPLVGGRTDTIPFAVAREARAIRRERTTGQYTKEKESIAFVSHVLSEMEKNRYGSRQTGLITFENIDDGVVCNVCAGHKANEALGRGALDFDLGTVRDNRRDRTGRIPDPAAPAFTVRAADVRDFLLSLEPAHMPGILRLALKRTALFKWKLVQIAKKFGAIDPDADYEKISIQRLLDYFDNTVVQQEAYRELLSGYMDVDAAAQIISLIKTGEIEVAIGPHSIIGADGILSSRDMIPPPTADQAVLATLKRRLEQDEVILACMKLRSWKSKTVVSRVPDVPQCPKCGARLIAALKPDQGDAYDIVSKKKKPRRKRPSNNACFGTRTSCFRAGKKQ